jgi:hypothetical protein
MGVLAAVATPSTLQPNNKRMPAANATLASSYTPAAYLPRLAGSTRRLPPAAAAAARPAAGAGVAAGASSSLSMKPPSIDCGGRAVPAVAAVAWVGSAGAEAEMHRAAFGDAGVHTNAAALAASRQHHSSTCTVGMS